MSSGKHQGDNRLIERLHDSAVSSGWKWSSVIGNLVLGSLELITGNVTSLAVTADGVHNLGDAITYHVQSDDIIKPEISAARLQRRRKLVHGVIAASSGAVAVKAGFDLMDGSAHAASDISLYAAGASVIYNSGLLLRLRQSIAKSHRQIETDAVCLQEKDLTKHLLKLDIPSAALAFGRVIAQRHGFENAEQLAACASGIIGAVAFRPTTNNLNHGH